MAQRVKMFSYGCRPPKGEARDELDRIFWQAHRYYNNLIAIERKRITDVRIAQQAFSTTLANAIGAKDASEAQLKSLRDQIKRAKAHGSTVNAEPLKAQAKTIRDGFPAQKAAVAAARQAIRHDPTLLATLADIDAIAKAARKAAYDQSPLHWGTKNHVSTRVEKAIEMSEGDLKFRRPKRDGTLYCQIQHGIDLDTALSCTNTWLQIEKTGHRRRHIVRVRIGTHGSGAPRWATFETFIHCRKTFGILPPGAKIMAATIVRRAGPQYRNSAGVYEPMDEYSIQFTVRYQEEPVDRVCPCRAVALDLGWRLGGDGSLRVALWYDLNDNTGELIMPKALLDRWVKCEDLQSIRDKGFNVSRKTLTDYCAANAGSLPDFLAAISSHVCHWKSPRRLARLVDDWRAHYRFPGDVMIYDALAVWRDREEHLYQWQRNNESKAQRIRKDLYRVWAKDFARRYQVVVMEKMNIAEMRQEPNPEDKQKFVVNTWRNAASIGLLRATMAQGGAEGVLVPAEQTTMMCHKCGGLNDWDRSELIHTCSHCKATWDQDENAAKNLLYKYLANPSLSTPATPPPDPAQPDGYVGRWQRRKDKKKKDESEDDDTSEA